MFADGTFLFSGPISYWQMQRSERDAVFVYSRHSATTKMRKGAIKNAETMPRQLFHPVYPVPHDEAAGLKIGIRN